MISSTPNGRVGRNPQARLTGADMDGVKDVSSPGSALSAALHDLSATLWRERELLELLLFKLEEEQLLLAGGRARWLARATHEVQVVVDEIRRAELSRAVDVDRVATLLNLPPSPGLRPLAEAAGEPWTTMLNDHREAFLVATAEVAALAENNREMLTASYKAVREALTRLSPNEAQTYSPAGAPTRSAPPRLFDRTI